MEDITPEQQTKIDLVRILVGDVEQSIFYPILTDEEYAKILEANGWNVPRAARTSAMSIAFQLSSVPYRERTGNIEVWNNASLQYLKVLDMFLNDRSPINLPAGFSPYGAGISKLDVEGSNNNSNKNRSPLAQITPCGAWWTEVANYPIHAGGNVFIYKE